MCKRAIGRPAGLALLVSTLAGGCSLPTVSATPRIAWMRLDGEIGAQTDAQGGSGTLQRTDTDQLGMSEQPPTFAPRAELDWSAVHLFADGLSTSFEGTGNVNGTFSIDDLVIMGNVPVHTQFDLAFARALLTFDLVPTDLVDIGIGVGVGVYDIDARITDLTLNQSASTEQVAPVPLAAGRIATDIGPVQLSGILSGIHAPLDDLSVTLFDADVAASYEFASLSKLDGHIVIGYRHIGLDADYEDEDDNVETDVRISGPYIGLTLSF